MPQYGYDERGRFFIDGYNKAKPFSSFLPGVAGLWGKPMWAFYVSRGQAIAGFGVRDKDGAMMEFYPANKAYAFVPTQGFRTFLRFAGEGGGIVEPFTGATGDGVSERLLVSPGKVELEYANNGLGLDIAVSYFTVPGEDFAALARRVSFTNTGAKPLEFEVLDGLAAILPYGTANFIYKELGNTIKAWMDVFNLDGGIPYYKLRASTGDGAEVTSIKEGHFLLGNSFQGGAGTPLSPIVDATLVFGHNTTYSYPDAFAEEGLEGLASRVQVTANKVPCGFIGRKLTLAPGETATIEAIYGHTPDIALINGRREALSAPGYLAGKEAESDALIDGLTSCVDTHTSTPAFDAYVRQCYLDNMLRGGKPVQLGLPGAERSYHVYSRKHGDLERDYNFFSLQPSYYSQGNGNFRDANQNRRNDVLIDPKVGDYNIRTFVSLIQADGYNPLVVRGCSFAVPADARGSVADAAPPELRDELIGYLVKPFTPGELLVWLGERGVTDRAVAESVLATAVSSAEQIIEADFGEGYWTDHWTYNHDLIETYLAVYPERLGALLTGDKGYAFFDSPGVVLPRSRKYVLAGEGKVRQYGAMSDDGEKHALISSRTQAPNWVRTGKGTGDVYRTSLFAKLVHLAIMKTATLDPQGLGIEMEGGRPGWNDSLNGLPGIFASGLGETAELLRVVGFLRESLATLGEGVALPVEAAGLMETLMDLMEKYPVSVYGDGTDEETGAGAFAYWDAVSTARETYRDATRLGFDGAERTMDAGTLSSFLASVEERLVSAIDRSRVIGNGLYPTFYHYEAVSWEAIMGVDGRPALGYRGMPLVRVTGFRRVDLPRFLEGPTRVMKVLGDPGARAELHGHIRNSSMYDGALGMYRTNESLAGATMEMGRSRAFTPGWLENESIFMHMEYKYLLELLKGGLYDEFYADMRTAMVPFLDPAVYGRSTLENSSFIASSANPDPAVHGTGFVARLSGSTAELLSMWIHMMTGGSPFVAEDGDLELRLRPVLPGWLFDDAGEVRFRFLGSCDVTFRNPGNRDTFGAGSPGVTSYTLTMGSGETVGVSGPAVTGSLALDVREGRVKSIIANIG